MAQRVLALLALIYKINVTENRTMSMCSPLTNAKENLVSLSQAGRDLADAAASACPLKGRAKSLSDRSQSRTKNLTSNIGLVFPLLLAERFCPRKIRMLKP